MLPLATEATTEEETNTDTICSQQITQANWIHASRHITDDREGQENLEWEAVIGSVSSATIEVNFDSEIDTAIVMLWPIGFEFLTSLVLHFLINKGLSQSKNKHKLFLEPTDDLCIWKESQTHTFLVFSK